MQQALLIGNGTVFAILLARLAGQEVFGAFSYVVAISALGVAISVAGLQGLAVREFALELDRPEVLAGSLISLRLFWGVFAIAVLGPIIWFSASGLARTAALLALTAALVKAFDVGELWFQSQLRAQDAVVVRASLSTVFLGLRVAIVIASDLGSNSLAGDGLVLLLGLTVVVEQLLVSWIVSARFLSRIGSAWHEMRPNARVVRRLAKLAIPVFVATVFYQGALRVGVLSVQFNDGANAVALYSAASRFVEILWVFPDIYMAATIPAMLVSTSGRSNPEVARFLRPTLAVALWGGSALAVFTIWIAPYLIQVIFGPSYSEATTPLRILACSFPLVFLNAVMNRWLLVNGMLRVALYRGLVTLLAAFALSLLLVPKTSIDGAATSVVVGIAIGTLAALLCTKPSREFAKGATLAFVLPFARTGGAAASQVCDPQVDLRSIEESDES